jgi:hypothetical protein
MPDLSDEAFIISLFREKLARPHREKQETGLLVVLRELVVRLECRQQVSIRQQASIR